MGDNFPTWGEEEFGEDFDNFIGRADKLAAFRENFAGDRPKWMILSITGEGGVGKSTLLKQYTHIAETHPKKITVILCDQDQMTPVEVMGFVSTSLASQKVSCREFDDLYNRYRQRREQAEKDPSFPKGLLDLGARVVTDVGLDALSRVPGLGSLGNEEVKKSSGDAFSNLAQNSLSRWSNKEDDQLLRDPERGLTPSFVKLLNQVETGDKDKRLVLMLDVFERTGRLLTPWLLELFGEKYGKISLKVTFVISGRDMLGQQWSVMGRRMQRLKIEPFSPEETREYLKKREITDDALVDQIHKETGGLPVLVELLAGTNPQPGAPLKDISGQAVKRFLYWTPPEKHQVALLSAVPNQFNLDILSALLGKDAAPDFEWLSEQSYIRCDTERGWYYHEKVRELMLRYQKRSWPETLSSAHRRMLEYFSNQQAKLGLENAAAYESNTWRDLEVERAYHLFSAHPEANYKECLQAFLLAFHYRWRYAGKLAFSAAQVATENRLKPLKPRVENLDKLVQAFEKDQYAEELSLLSTLQEACLCNPRTEPVYWAERGYVYYLLDRYEEALADLNRSLSLNEKDSGAFSSRALIYLQLNQYGDALSDFDRAIELDKENKWAIANRGETYRLMDKYQEALQDFDRAIALNDKYAWAIASRGQTYHSMDKYQEALKDFDRAIELDDTMAWAIAIRGETYRLMDKYQEALQDCDRAIGLDPEFHWAYEQKGLVLRQLNRFGEAIEAFNQAERTASTCPACLANRGETYRSMGKYQEALQDFDRAIALDDKNAWAIANRGETYRLMDKYQEALQDFDRVIGLDPEFHWAYEQKGLVLRQLNRFGEAIEAFNQAERTASTCPACIASRGVTYRSMGKYQEALQDFDRAIELDDKNAWAIANRGETYRLMDKYQEALQDFDRAIALDDKNAAAIANRGETYRLMDKYQEALQDFDRAIALDDTMAWAIASRGVTYRLMGKYQEALKDLDRAIELDDTMAWAIASRGVTYRLMGKYQEVLKDLDRAIELDDTMDWAFLQRGIVYRTLKDFPKAIEDINRAIALAPEAYAYYFSRGETYRRMGMASEAIEDFTQSILKTEPDISDFAGRAAAYMLAGDMPSAVQDLERALAMECKEPGDHYDRAVALVLAGQTGEALPELDIAFNDLYHRVYSQVDDLLDPIRDLPEFKALLEKER